MAAELLPLWGWQSIYLVGGVAPLVLLVAMFFLLPDSLEYLSVHHSNYAHHDIRMILQKIAGHDINVDFSAVLQTQAGNLPRSGIQELFSGSLRLTTLGVWSVYFFNWVAWFMLLSWLPTLLKEEGLNPINAPYASVTINAAFILCAIPLSWFLPRISTLKILYTMFATGIIVSLGLSVIIPQQQWSEIFFLIALTGFGVGGQQLALNYLLVTTYPTHIRATAIGWAIGMGRMGAILGTAIGGVVLSSFGTVGFFYILTFSLIISCTSMLIIRGR